MKRSDGIRAAMKYLLHQGKINAKDWDKAMGELIWAITRGD